MALNSEQRFCLDLVMQGAVDTPEALSDWETGFVASIAERREKYGDETLVSAKQWNILERIRDKLVGV